MSKNLPLNNAQNCEQLITISYHFPGAEEKHREAFAHLQKIITCPYLTHGSHACILSNSADLFPTTQFVLEPERTQMGLVLFSTTMRSEFPSSFFTAPSTTHNMISLAEVAEKLNGLVTAVDHTGLVVASSQITAADWEIGITQLAKESALYDYPSSPEYNPEQARWLFVIPSTSQEQKTDIGMQTRRLRQPKFELVWSNWPIAGTILQIDVETKLTREQLIKLIPQSYDIPGLESYFRSVNVRSPWSGLDCIRFDLRYKGDNFLDDWNSGAWLMESGTRIYPDSALSKLPKLHDMKVCT